MPGQFIPGADSHSRAYGAYGAVGIGVGSTTLGFGWSTGYVYFTLAKARRVVFGGRLQPWVSGKDIVLELLRRWGAAQSQGMSVELVDAEPAAADRLSQHDREHDGRSRSAERHLRARRDHRRVVSRQGDRRAAVSAVRAGRRRGLRDRRDDRSRRRRADDREAVQSGQRVSGRGGRARAPDVRQGDDRIVHQRQLRRSARGGARRSARRARRASTRAATEFVVFPGSGGVGRQIERPDPRLGGESIARGVPVGRRRRSGSRGAVPASVRARTRSSAGSARSRRSIATGRTAWASAAKATSPARPSSPRRRWSATWRRRASSGSNWNPEEFGV